MGEKLRDRIWIWGQDVNSHHTTHLGNVWNLPGENHMDPAEGCSFFGIDRCLRVVQEGRPAPPFDNEANKLDGLEDVVWSIIGDTGSLRNNECTDIDEVIRIAEIHPNVSGAIMDDFMNPERLAIYTPEKLHELRERLHSEIPGRKLNLWDVVYAREIDDKLKPWLDEIDIHTVWNWFGEDILKLDDSFENLYKLIDADSPVYAGCYLYDYGNKKPMDPELMNIQVEKYYKWLKEGYIQGIILMSNCIADIGLKAVDDMRDWIAQHGDEII